MAAVNVIYTVSPIAQTKSMSCWAAAAAMLLTWKNGIPCTEYSAAKAAGNNFLVAFQTNEGLPGTTISELASALNLKAEAPQNWTVTGYANLLKTHGPLYGQALPYSARPASTGMFNSARGDWRRNL